MELVRVDTQRAYKLLWDQITTLELAPGELVNEQELAREFEMGVAPVQEALKLLAHDGLVVLPPRYGFRVADVDLDDLEQISEMRLALETLCAQLAARRVTPDDIVVLESLCQELANTSPNDMRQLFELDHRLHQAVARAARNKYLAETLDRYFGLSRRLWYLVLPKLGFLPGNLEQHAEITDALKAGDADRAGRIMSKHVQSFYDQVRAVLAEEAGK